MIKYFRELEQGSDDWLAVRCGLLTASTMKTIVTPTLKAANNDKTRAIMWELAAQRVTKFVEPQYVSDDMLRGHEDEIEARSLYETRYGTLVEEVGFVTNDKWGFNIGYSPDGLVADNGLIECKSRRNKFQFQTIMEWAVPEEHVIQCQTAFLVSEREWLDYISYSGGMPMVKIRTYPDRRIMKAIEDAAISFEERMQAIMAQYRVNLELEALNLTPTERRVELEMVL